MIRTEVTTLQAHIPTDAELMRTLTPRETGLNFDEPDGISLLDTPLQVYETGDDTGTNYYVHLGDVALNGVQLYNFLLTTAPNDRDPGINDALADWNIVLQRDGRQLEKLHDRGLGEAWSTFRRGSKAYVDTTQGYARPYKVRMQQATEAYTNLDEADTYAFSQVIENLQRGTLDSTVAAFEPVTGDGQRDILYADASERINKRLRRASPITADATVSRVYNAWSSASKAHFIETHFSGLSAEELRMVTDAWYEREIPLGATPEPVLRPAISWRREDNSRKFTIGSQHFETQGRYKVCTDGVLGALAIAYLSPEVRTQWPKYIGLPGSNDKQPMGPVQVPVLTLMFEKQLLDRSSLVRALEAVD